MYILIKYKDNQKHMKVYKNGKLDIIETIKANMPRPTLTRKYQKEDKDRAVRARRDARLAKFN